MLIELSSLGVKFAHGEGAWALEDNLLIATKEAQEVSSDAPIWEHEDINIDLPSLRVPPEISVKAHYILHFDGAFGKGKGAGGLLLYDGKENCIGG
jgi:hypothetical protein